VSDGQPSIGIGFCSRPSCFGQVCGGIGLLVFVLRFVEPNENDIFFDFSINEQQNRKKER
jgi:hypothetical protein